MLPATTARELVRTAAEPMLAATGRFRVLASVPGSEASTTTPPHVVRTMVAEARSPSVLDADGLNALAGDFTSLEAWWSTGAAAVLTPHAGEYQRLLGRPVGGDRLEAARLADRGGVVVLLKGPGTVVAGPDGRVGGESHGWCGAGDGRQR